MPVLGEHSVANVLCYLHAKTFVYAEDLSKKNEEKRSIFGSPRSSKNEPGLKLFLPLFGKKCIQSINEYQRLAFYKFSVRLVCHS